MTKYKLEYIWLDGYKPVPNLRGKTQIKDFDAFPTLDQLPLWGFDGSSTMQAEGHSSDCVLKPVALYPDAARINGVLVMCEVMMPDGKTPHPSNMRATILDDPGAWFGFEQEYFFYKDGRPLGFPSSGYPAPQGPYYTGVGYKNVGDIARKMVEEHLDLCLAAGINHEGINAEVAKGQWEFQIFGKGSKRAADEMWMARYLMLRLTETYGVDIDSLQAAWRYRLERLRHALQFLDHVPSRDRRQGLFRGTDEGVCRPPRGTHRGLRPGQPDAAYRQARDRRDRRFHLRCRRPRRLDPVPHSFVNNGYKGYLEDRGRFARRPVPDRFARAEDGRLGANERPGQRRGVGARAIGVGFEELIGVDAAGGGDRRPSPRSLLGQFAETHRQLLSSHLRASATAFCQVGF